MRSSNRFSTLSASFALIAALPLAACGGSEPPPVAPPPAPTVTASAAPAPPPPPPPPPAVTASAAPEPPPPPKPKFNHRQAAIALFVTSLDSLELTAEQKTTVEALKADLAKHAEVAKEPREKLQTDVAAGVTAGKLDKAKIDADIRALSAAVAATQPALQDDMNRLHKALTPEQRKKLIETARAKGKEMHEHGMAMHAHDHEHGGPEHAHEHGDKGPEQAHEHGDKGPEHMHEHGDKGMWEGPLAKLTEELSLTPEQSAKLKAKVEALVKSEQATMKDKMMATAKHLDAVGTAFESDKFDAKKAGIGTQAPDLVASIAKSRVAFVEAVLSVLTPEQRPKFLAHVQAHASDMD